MRFKLMTFLAVFFAVLMVSGCNEQQAQQDSGSIQLKEYIPKSIADADIVCEKDGWKLLIYKTNKGTRSEGRDGKLFKDGKEIFAKKGETLETPIGKLIYNGSKDEAANLWDTTGWSIVISDQLLNSDTTDEVSTFRSARQKIDMNKLKNSLKDFEAKQSR